MIKLPPITWTYEGCELSVSLYVDGDRVVGMTPVAGAQPVSAIQLAKPEDVPRYLGDRMGAAIAQRTGREPCWGCTKVEQGLNGADRAYRKVKNLASRRRLVG